MIPVVTPEEMGEIDRAAPEPTETLVERAGAAVSRAALAAARAAPTGVASSSWRARATTAPTAGRRRGAPACPRRRCRRGRGGRRARPSARRRPGHRRRVRHRLHAAATRSPDAGGVPVLAVDIPSGVDGLTGRAQRIAGTCDGDGDVRRAEAGPAARGRTRPGRRGRARRHRSRRRSIRRRPRHRRATSPDGGRHRPADSHKWRAAVWIVGGSPGMTGAPSLAARAAMRSGVRLRPSVDPRWRWRATRRSRSWCGRSRRRAGTRPCSRRASRFGSIVVGPGPRAPAAPTRSAAREVARRSQVPVVVDGDGLRAIAGGRAGLRPRPRRPCSPPRRRVRGARRRPARRRPHRGRQGASRPPEARWRC